MFPAAQERCICQLIESADDDIPDNEDRDPQLSVLMNKCPPEIGLRNRRFTLIPSDDLAPHPDVERRESPGDPHRLYISDRVAIDVMISVGNGVLREHLSRTIASGSPYPIVEHDLGHGSPDPSLLRPMPLPVLGSPLRHPAKCGHRLTSPRLRFPA